MILPDVNVLVLAHNALAREHSRARAWWEKCLAGPEAIGLPWASILGFIRVTTNRRIFKEPLPVAEAVRRVDQWLALPHVHIVHPASEHFDGVRTLLMRLGTAGNLTTDAHLAALAMEGGYVLYSTDTDFARFPGLRWENPCE